MAVNICTSVCTDHNLTMQVMISMLDVLQAVLNTVLVIFMVFATSGLLFGINTGLSELSKITYTR